MSNDTRRMAEHARTAAWRLQTLESEAKTKALLRMADALEANQEQIVEANDADLAAAELTDLALPLMRRLEFGEKKIAQAAAGLRDLARLPDPVGETTLARRLADGMTLYRVRCPIGVIGVIFESRPDALVQISALCLKSGNAVLLKGGSEAARTNRVLADILIAACFGTGVPDGWLGLMASREDVGRMLGMEDQVDLIIPRGSNEFVRYIMEHTRIPVLGHADGICHTYVDRAADPDMAVRLCVDGKTQYVAVCNATETILVHADAADAVLPLLGDALRHAGVTLYGDERARAVLGRDAAPVENWRHEYLDYAVSVRIVDHLADAVSHINRYGSGHTDAIVTGDRDRAAAFLGQVDSGNVFWNCSTRFSDGFRYGFGAEVGVSTSKIHARGPVGLEGLLTYKYKLLGQGDIVADFAEGRRSFTHENVDESCPV